MDEKELIKLAQSGDQSAFSQLLQSYTGLIISIAKSFCFDSLQLEDLIQEGNMGFYKAVLKYDTSKNTSLSAYSYNYIRGAVFDYVKAETLKNVPDSIARKYFAYRRAKLEFFQDNEYEPDYDELAEYLDDGTTPTEIEEAFDLCEQIIVNAGESTDVVVYRSSSGEEELSDTIPVEGDHKEEKPEPVNTDVDYSDNSQEKYKDILSDIEYKVIVSLETNRQRRAKLNKESLSTTLYDDARKELGLTECKIRKIECVALRKIRRFEGD